MIRVITGSAKNKKLKVAAEITKPLTDRIKTSIFDTIQDIIPGSRVLDIYAGSGAFGIEALSRSAKHAKFIEANPLAAETIADNLAETNLADSAEIINKQANEYLKLEQKLFDVIFLDPPFPFTREQIITTATLAATKLAINGVLIIRVISDLDLPKTLGSDIQTIYEKVYGKSKVYYYRNSALN